MPEVPGEPWCAIELLPEPVRTRGKPVLQFFEEMLSRSDKSLHIAASMLQR